LIHVWTGVEEQKGVSYLARDLLGLNESEVNGQKEYEKHFVQE